MTYRLTMLVAMLFASATVSAQRIEPTDSLHARPLLKKDSIQSKAKSALTPESKFVAQMDSAYESISKKTATTLPDSSLIIKKENSTNKNNVRLRNPDPTTATWLALVIPGGGQIYNRKFWKLPIVYGGFFGCLYAYNWNGQMYKDYRQAYLDIMDSDPNTDSYKDFFRPGYDFDANREYLEEVFKKRKDRYRRWRDLSIFAFIGVYAVSIIDAYVDAQLSEFDITEDIHLSIEPQIINDHKLNNNEYYGLNFHITF